MSNFNLAGLYRSNRGVILGVCQGIAEWRGISVFWVRLAVAIAIFLSGFWIGVVLYIALAMIMPVSPSIPTNTDEEQEFYSSISTSRQQALRRLQRTFSELDRRTRRLEDVVTKSEFDWRDRLKSGK